jgi:hypothetical protein
VKQAEFDYAETPQETLAVERGGTPAVNVAPPDNPS